MSPRHHVHPLSHLLALLLVSALPLLMATASADAAGQRASQHRSQRSHPVRRAHPVQRSHPARRAHPAHRACRLVHPRHHHVRGCTSRVHAHTGTHRHNGRLRLHPTPAPPTPQHEHAATAAVIASILATPCANTELTPAQDNLQAVAAAALCLVNQERARHGEMPLRPNADLAAAATAHSQEMVSLNYFGHIAPNGLTPLARVRETGYVPSSQDGYTIGENIAWGTLELSTPKAIVAAWFASPEHLANILEVAYRDTAIGVDPAAPASLSGGNAGAVYTQEFGVIIH